MKFKLLSDGDMKAIDALKEHHGGAKKIDKTIQEMRDFEARKKILAEKGYGEMIVEAQELVKKFPKVGDFEKDNNITYNSNLGVATCQVSGFQGAKVTHRCMQRIAASRAEAVYVPSEMIAVVDSILKAAETDELPTSILDAIPRLQEIKSFLDGTCEASPLMVDEGPLWFRGFAKWPDEQLVPYLPEWLKRNNAWRVIVSHTPRSDGRIQSRLDGGIFLIDTGMLSEYYKGGQASALEIRDDEVTAVYAAGERFAFPPPEIDYGPELVWTDHDGTPLPFETVDDIAQFLLIAEPIVTEEITTGVNRPEKVLLEKGHEKFNAIFRHDSEIGGLEPLPGMGGKKRFFRDSYLSEMAAYEMNRLLGLDNMPPTVFRTLNGSQGTLQLWAEGTMLDRERALKKILPPEALPWNRQMWDTRVFDNLINNFDRNQTNILIDPNWRMILIDHTRSFARDRSLPNPKQVIRCSRGLWYALRHLDEAEVRTRLSPYLSRADIDALFVRRELLVELIQELIDRKGEADVLS